MSGDLVGEDDAERTGALLYANDFADWKPKTDLLLRGSCYPQGGPANECAVSFGVGDWQKNLHVTGPRAWRAGVMFGTKPGEVQPFDRMPLTYENAFGGPGYAQNPVGKGYKTELMPTVEIPGQEVSGSRHHPEPGSYMPLNPLWPQRAGKMGKKYGAEWREQRYPFYSEDFDWGHFNAAPADQQLDAPLRGDEELLFQNMHPEVPVWRTRLPGVRVRALVKCGEATYHDVPMVLDTLFADLEEATLYLTWRGHCPVDEVDLSDVAGVLTAAEPLESEPASEAHYRAILDAFLADPVAMEDAFPPGFAETGKLLEAEEAAMLADLVPPPTVFPPECSLTPLLNMRGAKDPLGIQASMPPAFLGPPGKDPVGVLAALPPSALAGMGLLQALPKDDPVALLGALQGLAGAAAPGQEEALGKSLGDLAGLLEQASQEAGPDVLQPPPPAPPPPPPDAQLAQAQADLEQLAAAAPEATAALADAPSLPAPSAVAGEVMGGVGLDASGEAALQPPDFSAIDAELAQLKAKLAEQATEAAASAGADNPLLGIFDKGQRLLEGAPTPERVLAGFDLSPLAEGLATIQAECLAIGVAPAKLAGLGAIIAGVGRLAANLPPAAPAPPDEDLAGQDLRQQDLRGRDLSGRNLKGADLRDMDLQGVNLSGSILYGAQLQRANLDGAQLSQADLRHADLTEAHLSRADLSRAYLSQATLSWCQGAQLSFVQSDLREASLDHCDFQQAYFGGSFLAKTNLSQSTLPASDMRQANLQGADLSKSDLSGSAFGGARLVEADLTETVLDGSDMEAANLESAKGGQTRLRGVKLVNANLRFAELPESDLTQAQLRGSDLSQANLEQARADGIDLAETTLDMTALAKSRLRRANLHKAKGSLGSLAGSNLCGATLREVEFEGMDFGKAALEDVNSTDAALRKCSFRGARLARACLNHADLTDAVVSEGADLADAKLLCIDAPRAVFQGSHLTHADFSHAYLPGTQFQQVEGTGANFFGAQLQGSSWRRAALAQTEFVSADLRSAEI
jgi:uncharacterized protein YjbI with pentapeptide repeats